MCENIKLRGAKLLGNNCHQVMGRNVTHNLTDQITTQLYHHFSTSEKVLSHI